MVYKKRSPQAVFYGRMNTKKERQLVGGRGLKGRSKTKPFSIGSGLALAWCDRAVAAPIF